MPIVIIPPEGNVLTPGQQIIVDSSLIGPVEPGSQLLLEIFQEGSEEVGARYTWQVANTINFVSLVAEHYNRGPWQAALPDGAPITVTTRIFGPSGTFDSGTTTGLTWSTTGQLQELLEDTTDGAGLTAEQAAQLQRTDEATSTVMSIGGESQVVDLISMLLRPPLGLMGGLPLTPPQSGDGTIPNPDPDTVIHWGLIPHFVVIPPHLGRFLLGLPRFSLSVLQLRVVHTLHGVDFYSEVQDFDRDNVIFRWAEPLPTRIEYSILPGVQVQFTWLG